MTDPTSRSDPEGYLSSLKFSQSLRCKTTGKRVSYADIGDPDGTPLLMLMPSGCSRWFAAPQDPLAKRYRIRIIAVDRPGVGATEMVPLQDRIRLSCGLLDNSNRMASSSKLTPEMIVSVLEHLDVQPRHILAHSAGIYYALQLLLYHSRSFQPPTSTDSSLPYLYLMAPWSPLLPPSHPDYYSSHLAWIPPKLIETQHLTLPHLMTLAKGATSLVSLATSTWKTGLTFAKSSYFSLTSGSTGGSESSDVSTSHDQESEGSKLKFGDEPSHVDIITPDRPSGEPEGDNEEEDDRLWGDLPCCVGCTTTEYVHAENYQGVGQEHLICLNHGPENTGHEWIEDRLKELAIKMRKEETKLDVQVWWGLQDGMVPRKGQIWLNKAFEAHPEFNLTVHEVSDGDHADLVEGIHRVYGLIWERSGSRAVDA